MRTNFNTKIAVVLLLLFGWLGSSATHFNVITLSGNWQGSLTWALNQVNNDTTATRTNPHVIDINSGGEATLTPLPTRPCIINCPADMGLKLSGITYHARALLKGVHITINNAVFDKANYNADFGAALMAGSGATFIFNDCLFINNTARYQGAAVFCDGDTVYLTGCTFKNNCTTISTGGGGAAVYNNGGYMLLANCTFSGNTSVAVNNAGGAVRNCGEMDVIDCRFYGNHSANIGGALDNRKGSVCRLSNSIFTDNNAANGGNDLSGEFLYLNGLSLSANGIDIYHANPTAYGTLNSILLFNASAAGPAVHQFIIVNCDEQVETTEVYSIVDGRVFFLKGMITKLNAGPLAQGL